MANMANTETDKLPLVETYQVGPGKWFLPPAVRPDVGYSLQIFSPEGEFKGSVTPKDIRMRAKEHDQVMRINLGRHQVPISGKVISKDNFEREFSLIASVHVSDPQAFAIAYRQQSDPIAQLISAVTSALMGQAKTLLHDAMDVDFVSFWAKTGGNTPRYRIGVSLDAIEQPILKLSARHWKLLDTARDETQRAAEWGTQQNINQGNREETAKDGAAKRAEDEANADTTMRIKAKEVFTMTMVNAFAKRMQDALMEGVPLAVLRAQDPDFAAWQDQLASGPGSPAISAPSSAPSGPMVDALPSGAMLPEDSSPRYIEILGATCEPTKLTDEQRLAAETQHVTPIQCVYVIRSVDEGGVAAQCNLAADDVILQVAEEHLPDIESISQRLASATFDHPVVIHICRGVDIYQATPAIAQ